MKKIIGTIVLIVGLLMGVFSVTVVYKWVNGGYVVQEVSYEELVSGHTQLGGKYLKLIGARIDTQRITDASIVAGMDPETGQIKAYESYTDRYYAPLVGSASDEPGAVVEITGKGRHDAIIAQIGGLAEGERYVPIELDGLVWTGELPRVMSLAVEQMGLDPQRAALFDAGVAPIDKNRRIWLLILTTFAILAGFELRSDPKKAK